MRLRSLAPLIALLLLLSACEEDTLGPGDDPTPVAGTYALVQVNGAALPVTLPEQPPFAVLSGSLTLTAQGTYAFSVTGRDDGEDDTWTDTFEGTFRLAGSSITLTAGEDFTPRPGTVSGSTATLPLEGEGGVYVFTFQR